jgi:2-polyprenyl-3-methyl-5-hydroxy-6-metoxy-1,4-benzoquinol methylase
MMDRAFWDQRYRSSAAIWSGRPNPHLVAQVADLPPSSALDVGCGEGADAVWLAEHGWRVTAVDISPVALERAERHAATAGSAVAGRITWQRADLTDTEPAHETYDLVSAQFLHLPTAQRVALYRRLAAAVAPGGTLLIVSHSPRDLDTTLRRPQQPEMFPTAAELAASLDPRTWTVLVSAAEPHQALDPDGRAVTAHDEILRAQRRP